MTATVANELYRNSGIGASLMDTLDDFIKDGSIESQLARKVMGHFDKCVADVLVDKVRARMSFKANRGTYRFCDDVWTFQLKDVNCKLDGGTLLQAETLKIVAMGMKSPDEM